jgi:Transcriptional regulator, AbiEi antitoxin
MVSITDYLTSSGGYARMKELRAAGFQSREITALVVKGQIERVKPGLYRLFLPGTILHPLHRTCPNTGR